MVKQIALISKEPLPVIFGIWHQRPSFVLFLITEGHKRILNNIISIVKQKHKFEYDIQSVDPYDKVKINKAFSRIDNSRWSINITCGTKIMSIISSISAIQNGVEVFYIKALKKNMKVIFPFSRKRDQFLKPKLSVKQYLEAHGRRIKKCDNKFDEINKMSSLTRFISSNSWVQQLLLEVRQDNHRHGISYGKTYEAINNGNFINLTFPNKDIRGRQISVKLTFGSKEKTKMLNILNDNYLYGGWFEHFVFTKIKNCVDDVLMNVELKSNNPEHPLNEIDILATKENRIHIISCKTMLKLTKYSGYELLAYKDLAGGLFAQVYLATTTKPTSHQQERLDLFNIDTVFSVNLKDFNIKL